MSDKEREAIEWQAREFAGLVLAPRILLSKEYKLEKENAITNYGSDYPQIIPDIVIHSLAQKFQVSDEVIRIRLERDGIVEKRDKIF